MGGTWGGQTGTSWGLGVDREMSGGDKLGGGAAASLQSFIRVNNGEGTAMSITLKPGHKYLLEISVITYEWS